jgi:hypothetical protein
MRDRSESYRGQESARKTVEGPLLLKQQPKILFGLTGRQLLILTCGLAIGFSLWESLPILQKSVVATGILGCVCTLLSAILAFIPLDARPLEEWCVIILLWLLTPERVSLSQLFRLFIKIKGIREDIVTIEPGGYQAVLVVEGKQFDLLSSSEQGVLIESFAHFLNGLSYGVTIHIRLLPYAPAITQTTIIPSQIPKALRRWYAYYLSFLSELIAQRKPVRVVHYMALTIPAEDVSGNDEPHRLEQVKVQFAQRICEVERQLGRGGLTLRRLSTRELFAFYYQGFTQEAPQNGLSLENLAPSAITIAGSWLKVERKHGHYLACLAISQLPRRMTPGWLHQLVEANDAVSSICLSIEPCTGEAMTNYLRRKAMVLKGVLLASRRRGEQAGNTMTYHALGDIERIRDQLMRKDTRLYVLTLFLIVRSSSPSEVEARVKHVQLLLRSLDFQAVLLRFQQHLGFFSTLYGQNMLQRHNHLITTEVAAAFFPFSSVPVMEKNILLGATANGGLVSLDVWEGFNANLAILGIPGSGKSFFLKTILSRLAICEERLNITVIDIEGEYSGFAQALGAASQVVLSADALQINPFDLKRTFPQRGDFQEKIATLVGFFALLFGEQGILTQRESALLHSALIETYAEVGITDDIVTYNRPVPSISDFSAVLRRKTQTENFYYLLSPYIHLFPKNSYNVSDGVAIYNLRALPESLLPIGMYLIIEKLWNSLQEGRMDNEAITTRHIVTIDEAWFLSKFAYGGLLLNDFARRMRKYGAGLWLGTQQIGDLLSSAQGKDLLALCHRKMLFRQDASSIDVIQNTLHLSMAQVKHLQTAKCGEAPLSFR